MRAQAFSFSFLENKIGRQPLYHSSTIRRSVLFELLTKIRPLLFAGFAGEQMPRKTPPYTRIRSVFPTLLYDRVCVLRACCNSKRTEKHCSLSPLAGAVYCRDHGSTTIVCFLLLCPLACFSAVRLFAHGRRLVSSRCCAIVGPLRV